MYNYWKCVSFSQRAYSPKSQGFPFDQPSTVEGRNAGNPIVVKVTSPKHSQTLNWVHLSPGLFTETLRLSRGVRRFGLAAFEDTEKFSLIYVADRANFPAPSKWTAYSWKTLGQLIIANLWGVGHLGGSFREVPAPFCGKGKPKENR